MWKEHEREREVDPVLNTILDALLWWEDLKTVDVGPTIIHRHWEISNTTDTYRDFLGGQGHHHLTSRLIWFGKPFVSHPQRSCTCQWDADVTPLHLFVDQQETHFILSNPCCSFVSSTFNAHRVQFILSRDRNFRFSVIWVRLGRWTVD